MAETKKLQVFLCHASADKPKVSELYRYLRRRGIAPWLDAEDLLPGQDWQIEIPKALLASDVIVVCLTQNSVTKEGYVQKEIGFALDKAQEKPGAIFIIPAKLEACDVPDRLSRYHWVDLHLDGGYARLMRSLKLRADQLERTRIELSKTDEISPHPGNVPSFSVGQGVSGTIIVGDDNTINVLPTLVAPDNVTQHEERAAEVQRQEKVEEQRIAQKQIEQEPAPDEEAEKDQIAKAEDERIASENAEQIATQKTEDAIKAHEKHESGQHIRAQIWARLKIPIFLLSGLFFVAILLPVIIPIARTPITVATRTQTVLPRITENYLTNIPTPTITPTVVSGHAVVQGVTGGSANVKDQQILSPGAEIISQNAGIRIVVGQQSGKSGVTYWFANSVGKLDFDAAMMKPLLSNGLLYIQPGSGSAEIHFAQPDIIASVSGGRMIVEVKADEIIVYCFEGKCRLDVDMDSKLIPVKNSLSYNIKTQQWIPSNGEIPYDEQWDWNIRCNRCMDDFIPSPTHPQTITPTATVVPGQAMVQGIIGGSANVKDRQILLPGTEISSQNAGIRIVVGLVRGVGVTYWFANSVGKVDFDAYMMKPLLSNSALYIQPGGSGSAEIHFAQPDIIASVSGGRMIVDVKADEIIVYCFEGKCRLDVGIDGKIIPVKNSLSYNIKMQQWIPSNGEIPYDEQWDWNIRCNRCMDDVIPSPTPTPTVHPTSVEVQTSPTKRKPH